MSDFDSFEEVGGGDGGFYVDEFTEVSETGFGQNFMSSLGGVILGPILFLIAFPILWWNEGRVDLSKVAQQSIVLPPDGAKPEAEGKLVSITAEVTTEETIQDPEFLRPLKGYLALRRKVEMYAWKEEVEERTEKKLGGGKRKVKKYRYKKGWTEDPEKSSNFRYPQGHENPPMPFRSQTFQVSEAQMGDYRVAFAGLTLPGLQPLPLSKGLLKEEVQKEYKFQGSVLFKSYRGKSSLSSPQVGDLRISFSALPQGQEYTLFGKLQGDKIVAYTHTSGDKLFRLFATDRAGAISTLKQEHLTSLWIWRLIGLLCMWIGMFLFFSPLIALLDILPILGDIGSAAIGGITFVLALVLSTITIIVAKIFHSPIALTVMVLLLAGGVYYWLQQKKSQAPGNSLAGSPPKAS